MKFREFVLRRLLRGTDYLVGYDAINGEYIQISKEDLASSVAANATAQTLTVQYSANRSNWVDSYAEGCHYMRIKVGSGAWSGAIPLCVSAYDVWKQQGHNNGTVDDFLASLKGEHGEAADPSAIQIQDIDGYSTLLQWVNAAIQNDRNSIVADAVAAAREAVNTAIANKFDKDLSNLNASGVIADDCYIPVVTKSGEVVKVKAGTLAAYTEIRSKVENSSMEAALKSQRIGFAVSGNKDGANRVFTLSSGYTLGTSAVYFNGQRLYAGTDYREDTSYQFTFIGDWVPVASDIILFEAVPLSVESISQEISQNQ